MAVHDLEVLNRIFDIHNPPGTMFQIDCPGLYELFQLLAAQVERC